MTVEISTIHLLEVASDSSIEAELRDAIENAQLTDWRTHWQPAMRAVLDDLIKRGVPRDQWPQSSHWDWPAKVAQVEGLLAFKGFCVVCAGMTQGLMRIDLNQTARESRQAGMPLVYVDYLEVAPWNRADLGQAPRYSGVGTALVVAAVELSRQEGFKGRIGLHSLPQADRFYRDRCRMTDLGPDVAYPGRLRYFEMTSEQADAFLAEEEEE
jgi:hypothetical protein